MQPLIVLLLAAVALWGMARLARQTGPDGTPRIQPLHLGIGVALLVTGAAVGHGAGALSGLFNVPSANADGTPLVKGRDTGFSASTFGVDEGFMQFVDKNLAADDAILFVCGLDPCDESKVAWMGTRLAPRPIETSYRDADWLVFVGAEPVNTAYKAFPLRDTAKFGEGMLVAKAGPKR